MASYNGEEKCALMTWATLSGDVNNEVLVETKVKIPDANEMYDELLECISSSTDDRIRNIDPSCTSKIISDGPWSIHTDDQATLLLYKLWYDSVTLRMGLKPMVTVFSTMRPHGMPNHWAHVHSPKEIQWSYDASQDVLYNDEEGVRIEYMHPDTQPEESQQVQAPAQPVQQVQTPAQPAQQLPWYHPNWVPEVPYWNQPTRKSKRAHSGGVQKLSYNSQGQCESNTVIAKAVWESLHE